VTGSNPTSTAALRITRTFPASRERIFDAFTKPELLKQWWGPAGFTLPGAEVDLRVGGRYRFTMQPPQGDAMYLSGTFKEITRPQRLVYTWAWEQAPVEMSTTITLEFNEAEGDTEVVLTQEPFTTEEFRQQHDAGWQGGFDKLEAIFRREKRGKA
jgi:uncharacterized protein YndB with AHSA1/START domain